MNQAEAGLQVFTGTGVELSLKGWNLENIGKIIKKQHPLAKNYACTHIGTQ